MHNPINMTSTQSWKKDVSFSVDFYNDWFLNYAPSTYREERKVAQKRVDALLKASDNLKKVSVDYLKAHPDALSILRLSTAPPLARDRMTGLSHAKPSLIDSMENKKMLPPRMDKFELDKQLGRIVEIINQLLDVEIFPWLPKGETPSSRIRLRSASIIADRVCGSIADPLIRNEQEKRQLKSIQVYLESLGYRFVPSGKLDSFRSLQSGCFSYHLNVPVVTGASNPVNMPIDVAIKRSSATAEEMPILIECKSAGDFTNTNKRRKEEAQKISQLKHTYGDDVEFVLFLCGYFDSSYLGYEASEGIDWIWEHRISDFDKLDL